jgi:hypothetical protein
LRHDGILTQFTQQVARVEHQSKLGPITGVLGKTVGQQPVCNKNDADGQGGAAVKVEYDLGERGTLAFDGRVVRVLGNLAQSGRLARILVQVDDPLRLKSDKKKSQRLFAGAYVRCLIEGEEIADTFSLPSALVREGNKVWIMDENNLLDIRPVETIWRQGNQVLIAAGIEAGERIVSSHIAVPMPGASLREKGAQAANGPQKGKKGDER